MKDAASRNRKLPPYGRAVVQQRITATENLNLWIYGGSRAWDEAKWRTEHIGAGTATLLPPGDDPNHYRWPVKGLKVMLVWLDGTPDDLRQDATENEITKLATALLLDGAALVVAPFTEDPEGFLFFKPKRN